MSIIKQIIKASGFFSMAGSELMKTLLRLNGAKIGKNTFVSFSSRIVSGNLVIGNDVVIKSHAKIKAKKVLIGNSCIISEHCYITGSADFEIGDTTFIGKKVRINVSENVLIGKDVGIGENSVIWTHGYFPPADEGYPVTYKPVTIKDGAWVSTNIIILPGVVIGKNAIIGAGSVVTKSFEDNSLIAGNPAKYLKNTNEMKSDKGFIAIMKDIFKKYPEFSFVEEGENYLIYNLNKYKVYLFFKENDFNRASIDAKNSIVIFKEIDNPEYFKNNTFNWFDLSKREHKNMLLKEAKMIMNVFREWGIRLIVNYN